MLTRALAPADSGGRLPLKMAVRCTRWQVDEDGARACDRYAPSLCADTLNAATSGSGHAVGQGGGQDQKKLQLFRVGVKGLCGLVE